ncbi:LTA synthase family protein [Propionivibrio sp.]|uniref:LTA synthase family protein n=1 Tax=Propionivibrio sp. TaxID=2212460 RepID=UPI002627196C|nr:LTA synthase family protein [Propionivibrio sp.]
MIFSRIFRQRYAVAAYLALALCLVSFLTRIVLSMRPDVSGGGQELALSFLIGSTYDLVTAPFMLAPLMLFLALLPNRVACWRLPRLLISLGIPVSVFLLLFTAVAEWIFWDEFASRFNFIAVDYLVYTHEVIGNIWQSYPVGKILIGLALVSLLVSWPLIRRCWTSSALPLSWTGRLTGILLAIALPIALFYGVSSTAKNRFSNDSLNELAGNGFYEFAAAARNNEMDYMRLYASLPEQEAFAIMREKQSQTADSWRSPDLEDRQYAIRAKGAEKHLNVILISVESLGAEFIGAWGDPHGLTPRIDQLTRESLAFGKVYATGNRTVRGLEALTLAIPPTPGQSIVKRPNNAQLFSLGNIFENKGYDTAYIYGGYGYFDNMEEFFSNNDYRVIDRKVIAKEKIHYENIWGVADEDLFDQVIAEIDASLQKSNGKKPVFAHVMTTSNHRPYTYPDGRINIPSGTGREGAVKYTDWAIGHFIDEAKKKPWFADTLFVITADHGASARGTGEIPIDKYQIPVLFYAPAHIKPQWIDRLMSQIDISPTLLGQLNFSYDSKFFGQDIFRLPRGAERAFVANYQSLGYLRDGRLVMLYPRRKVQISGNKHAGSPRTDHPLDEKALQREAVAWYEAASLAFGRGKYLGEKKK